MVAPETQFDILSYVSKLKKLDINNFSNRETTKT